MEGATEAAERERLVDHSIEALLGGFEDRVEVTAQGTARDAGVVQEGFQRLMQACEALINASSGGDGNRYAMQELRARIVAAIDEMSQATRQLTATALRHAANLELVMGNAVLHHLASGTQDAPFLVVNPPEVVDIGFNADNPALPRSRYPAPFVELRRADFFV